MTTTASRTLALWTLALGTLALGWSGSAAAADWSFRVDIGRTYRPVPVQTATAVVVSQPVSARRWIPDTYQTRTQGVLAEAEHYERRWMPESFETRYDRCGMAYRIFHAGYWTDVFVPARYETRTVTVLIPGHWKEVQVCEPRVAEAPQPAYCGGAYIPRRRWR